MKKDKQPVNCWIQVEDYIHESKNKNLLLDDGENFWQAYTIDKYSNFKEYAETMGVKRVMILSRK